MNPARILIIDPHPATREGVRQFLAADPGRWEVCGCESNALQAIAQLAHLQPDLAIVEYEGHGMDGLELAAQLGRLPRTLEVMLYTANTLPSVLQRIAAAEVAGAVLKTEPLDELALGLETIRRGHRFRSGEITRLCRQAEEELQRTDPLSPSEKEILQLTSEGKATKEIALHRGVSIKTIEAQQRSIRQKLRVPCAPAAVGLALRHGLIR